MTEGSPVLQSSGHEHQRRVLLEPTVMNGTFQVSAHTCPKPMIRELKHVFPEIEWDSG